ncbi:MAG TPA: aminotransferase class I/II-fold pyridoxal phosphate-dependent enzyme [Longimicrobiales bacterium]|nr:aminotransferase class I/II-fold pyridoxal phosphate-dependent enzyme [Longimicrobiales bacterium]
MTERNELELDAETMRRLGYRVVDLLVERLANLDGSPAWRAGDRAELERALRRPPPDSPVDFDVILESLARDALPHGGSVDHPRFFGFVPGSPTWPGILGDLIAAGYNVFQGSWLGGSGASEIELIVLDWFKGWVGYPDDASGLFTSGGSAANLTAIALARQLRFGGHDDRAVIYMSTESHSSCDRAARILGFRPDRVRRLPVDDAFRLDLDAFRHAVAADRAAGLEPFFAIANGGATSTGAIDPLRGLSKLCAREQVWLHVDAAYGGFAVLTDRGLSALDGLGLADSMTLDPHKWLYQPFEAGCLLVRNGPDLERAFRVLPDYLQDAAIAEGDNREQPVNFMDRGIQLTRSARAIKVWISLQYFGVDAFRATIDRTIDLAAFAEQRLRASGRFEILSPATLGVVCFRRIDDDGGRVRDEARLDAINAQLLRRLCDSGFALMSSTRVRNRYSLRFCILGHRTRRADVERTIEWLENSPVTTLPEAGGVGPVPASG